MNWYVNLDNSLHSSWSRFDGVFPLRRAFDGNLFLKWCVVVVTAMLTHG